MPVAVYILYIVVLIQKPEMR